MKLQFTWNEFKQLAYAKIKETYPDIVDDDTVKFLKFVSHEGLNDCYELPDVVEIALEDK